jgi:hypothetical protein
VSGKNLISPKGCGEGNLQIVIASKHPNILTSGDGTVKIALRSFSLRTTLDIDEDVMNLARVLAREKEQSIGRVISDLARRGIHAVPTADAAVRNGVPLLGRRAGVVVTSEDVRALLDSEE